MSWYIFEENTDRGIITRGINLEDVYRMEATKMTTDEGVVRHMVTFFLESGPSAPPITEIRFIFSCGDDEFKDLVQKLRRLVP